MSAPNWYLSRWQQMAFFQHVDVNTLWASRTSPGFSMHCFDLDLRFLLLSRPDYDQVAKLGLGSLSLSRVRLSLWRGMRYYDDLRFLLLPTYAMFWQEIGESHTEATKQNRNFLCNIIFDFIFMRASPMLTVWGFILQELCGCRRTKCSRTTQEDFSYSVHSSSFFLAQNLALI